MRKEDFTKSYKVRNTLRPGNYTLSIFDAKGIEKSKDYIYIDQEVFTVDTQLASGIYFISLENDNGQKFTEKVLILKE